MYHILILHTDSRLYYKLYIDMSDTNSIHNDATKRTLRAQERRVILTLGREKCFLPSADRDKRFSPQHTEDDGGWGGGGVA